MYLSTNTLKNIKNLRINISDKDKTHPICIFFDYDLLRLTYEEADELATKLTFALQEYNTTNTKE